MIQRKIEIIAIIFIVISTSILAWIILENSKSKPASSLVAPKAITAPETTPQEKEAISVRVRKIAPQDFEDVLPALGTVRGYLEIPLKFEISGVIKSIEVKEGTRLKKGDLIAALDDNDAQLKLQYAKKKLESVKAQFLSADKKREIFEGLYKAGAVIKQKLEEATLEADAVKSQLGMAEAEIKIAEAELNKTRLLSPKDGIIGSKDVEAGEFVSPQNKTLSLFNLEKVYVELGIVEKDIEKIKIGQKVEVQLDSYPQEKFVGSIDNILPIIEGKSRTLTAKVLLDNNKGLLLPGMFSRAKIYIAELKDAILVPRMSILSISPEVNVVPLIDLGGKKPELIEKGEANGLLRLRKVTIGYATSDYIQVIEGLKAGDLIVIEAQGELKDEAKVRVAGIEEPLI